MRQLSYETVIGVLFVALCLLSNDIMDYHIVAQGKTVIAGVDDGEEMKLTDVSPEFDDWLISFLYLSISLCLFINFSIHSTNRLLLMAEVQLGQRVCLSEHFGFCRNNDAKQPHLGLSHHKSRQDTDTWSQRRSGVRNDGRKSRTAHGASV